MNLVSPTGYSIAFTEFTGFPYVDPSGFVSNLKFSLSGVLFLVCNLV